MKKNIIVVEPGTQIVKRSRNPFKSGDKVGTVEALCTSLYGPNPQIAYVMQEDGSIVNAGQCKQLVPESSPA